MNLALKAVGIENVQRGIDLDKFLEMMKAVPEKHLEKTLLVVQYRYKEGKTTKETASLIGMSYSWVRSTEARLLRILRQPSSYKQYLHKSYIVVKNL